MLSVLKKLWLVILVFLFILSFPITYHYFISPLEERLPDKGSVQYFLKSKGWVTHQSARPPKNILMKYNQLPSPEWSSGIFPFESKNSKGAQIFEKDDLDTPNDEMIGDIIILKTYEGNILEIRWYDAKAQKRHSWINNSLTKDCVPIIPYFPGKGAEVKNSLW